MVLSVSLKMLWSFLVSSLVGVHPSQEYVNIGIIIVSTICHTACIFIPLNSLFPVSASIVAVAPFIFFSISSKWSDRLLCYL